MVAGSIVVRPECSSNNLGVEQYGNVLYIFHGRCGLRVVHGQINRWECETCNELINVDEFPEYTLPPVPRAGMPGTWFREFYEEETRGWLSEWLGIDVNDIYINFG